MNLLFIINYVKIEIKIVNLFIVQRLFDNKIYLKIKKKKSASYAKKVQTRPRNLFIFPLTI